jgi:hypothetical protein
MSRRRTKRLLIELYRQVEGPKILKCSEKGEAGAVRVSHPASLAR